VHLRLIQGRVARFFLTLYTKMGKMFELLLNYQMAIKYSKWPYKIPTFSILRPTKIYPNRDFRNENIPCGNSDIVKFLFRDRYRVTRGFCKKKTRQIPTKKWPTITPNLVILWLFVIFCEKVARNGILV
jgi:hypothetical protein